MQITSDHSLKISKLLDLSKAPLCTVPFWLLGSAISISPIFAPVQLQSGTTPSPIIPSAQATLGPEDDPLCRPGVEGTKEMLLLCLLDLLQVVDVNSHGGFLFRSF